MSGAEVLGILGVLPLLVTAVEHYEDTLRPFIRYRTFSSKVLRIHDELETERTIFRTECLLMLAGTTDRDTAIKMISDPQHPSWTNEALQERFRHKLGALGYSCETVISSLNEKLVELSKKAEQLSTAASQPADREIIGDRKWRHRIGKKLKFALSDLGIQRLIEEIRILNKTFLTLSSQVVRLETKWPESAGTRVHQPPVKNASQALRRFRTVQKASRSLFDSLAQACTKHTHHLAHLSLDTPNSEACSDPEAYQIRFKLAYNHIESQTYSFHSTKPADHYHRAVIVSNSINTMPADIRTRTVNSAASQASPQNLLGFSRSVEKMKEIDVQQHRASEYYISWFEVETTIVHTRSVRRSDQSSDPSGNTVNAPLKKHSNFCAHQADAPTEGVCTCVLGHTPSYKHIVHHPSLSLSSWSQRKVISLAASITSPHGLGWNKEMPQFKRLNIARTLALAVLQFYSTPWLVDTWHSHGIHVFEGDESSVTNSSVSSSPFLHVRVGPIDGNANSEDTDDLPPSIAYMVPNLLLFRLGIMFLELAYSATFRVLRTSFIFTNINLPMEEGAADFVRARMLAEDVGSSLGVDFATIVKKCLRCDFGCGEDLKEPELQTRLYEDVVCKLEQLEEGFRRLQAPV